jgi:hypothetical protein
MSATKHRSTNRPELLIVLLFGAVALSLVSLKFFPKPFIWVGMAWASALMLGTFFFRKPWQRATVFNIGFAAAMLTVAEAYFWFFATGAAAFFVAGSATYPPGYVVRDDVLGYAPAKGVRAESTKSEYGRLLYDVTYTIGSDGLRVSAPVKNDKHSGCILFFGDSFTFGEGLQDIETLPYQVGIQSNGEYRTFNFGFSGYGPHQMLSEIEQGLIQHVVDCHPDYAIYSAMPHHVLRVAGKVFNGNHAPRYQLAADGSVHSAGYFDEKKSYPPVVQRLFGQLSKSAIYKVFANRQPSASQDDVGLLVAIVARSRELLQIQYPGIKFHIILWEGWKVDHEIYAELKDQFDHMGIPVHLVDDILPGWELGSPKYVLSRSDRHPSAIADHILANYVLTKIVSPDPRGN